MVVEIVSFAEDDEELAILPVWAVVGHADYASLVELVCEALVSLAVFVDQVVGLLVFEVLVLPDAMATDALVVAGVSALAEPGVCWLAGFFVVKACFLEDPMERAAKVVFLVLRFLFLVSHYITFLVDAVAVSSEVLGGDWLVVPEFDVKLAGDLSAD